MADGFYSAQLWLILAQIVSAMVVRTGVTCRFASDKGFAFGSEKPETISAIGYHPGSVGLGSFDPDRWWVWY